MTKNAYLSKLAIVLLAALPTGAAAQSRSIDTYVLFALKELRTKGLTVVSGHVGVNEPGGLLSASSHGVIDAPHSDVVAEMTRMSSGSRCLHHFSNVYRETCGPASALSPLPLVADPIQACGFPGTFPACNTGKSKVVLDGSTLVLPPDPAGYGDLRIFGSGQLVLTGGSYVFCSLRAGRNARIVVQHPATVHVQGSVNLASGTFLGPDATIQPPIKTGDVDLFVNGPMVHFSGSSDIRARLCAPNAWLRITHGANVEGTFVARSIRTERITAGPPTDAGSSTTTTTTTPAGSSTSTSQGGASTTTTLPDCGQACGNGHIDAACDEECDGNDFGSATCPGSSVVGAFLTCNEDCTIDDGACPCGNGVKDASEECDPLASPSGCPDNQTCGAAVMGAADACRCVSLNPEICGNCIDDDGNGQTDFEDAACCPQQPSFTMIVKRGRLRPRGNATKLRLRSILAQAGLDKVNPMQQDVFLQIRPRGGTDILCAKVPAMKFMRMHGAFKFWDRKHKVASAKGIDDMKVKVRKDKSVRLRTVGRRVQFKVPGQGELQVTVGFHDPKNEAQNSCSTRLQAFRTGRTGRLVAP